jgi:hypothetical protein
VCGVKICNVYVVNGNPVDSAAFLYRQVPSVYVSGLSLCFAFGLCLCVCVPCVCVCVCVSGLSFCVFVRLVLVCMR